MADYKVIDAEKLEADLTTVAYAIRVKGGTTEKLEFPQGMADAVSAIQSGGGEAVANPFEYVTNMNELYRGCIFPNNHELIINAPNFLEGMDRIIRYSKGLKSIKLIGNTNNNTVSMQYGFQQYMNETLLETVDFSEWGNGEVKVTYGNSAFSGDSKLITINGVFDFTNTVNINGMFDECRALENIKFKENTIKLSLGLRSSGLLSDASIQSIIDGLATVETTQTLALHADVKAKLTDTQLATITGKNWTVA